MPNLLLRTLPILLLLASSAHATVGGETEVTVLGHEPVDNKVYMLRAQHDSSDRVPSLIFYDLDEAWPTLHTAKAWSGTDRESHAKRLKLLKKRLRHLPKASAGSWTLTALKRGTEPCPTYTQYQACDVLDVTITVGARALSQRFYSWPGAREVKAAYVLPGGAHLFVFAHRGVTYEGGYREDVPLLIPSASAPTAALPLKVNCTQGKCALRVRGRVVLQTMDASLRCVEGAAWLGCLGKSDSRWLGWFVHRATGQVVPFGVPWAAKVTSGPTWGPKGLQFVFNGVEEGSGPTHRIAPPR